MGIKWTRCSGYSLLHIPFHTHQPPWPAFCEFLGTWHAGPEPEEKMQKMGKAYKNPRNPKQQTSLFILPVTGLCFPTHKSKPGYPSCLRCFIVLLCCGGQPSSLCLRLSLLPGPNWWGKMKKGQWAVRLPPHYSVYLVTTRFRRASNFGKWWTFDVYMLKMNVKLIDGIYPLILVVKVTMTY